MAGRLVPATAWPHIDPGKKRHKITIYAQGTTQDSYGQESQALTTVALSAYAAIETITTRELFQDAFVSQVIHRITLDWPRLATITPDMTVAVKAVTGTTASQYEIQSIENVQERNLVMILTCIEIDQKKVGQ